MGKDKKRAFWLVFLRPKMGDAEQVSIANLTLVGRTRRLRTNTKGRPLTRTPLLDNDAETAGENACDEDITMRWTNSGFFVYVGL
ncbi:MAG: hypothetical protein ABR530_04685 [Pyrinomonadaceae bacterium]